MKARVQLHYLDLAEHVVLHIQKILIMNYVWTWRIKNGYGALEKAFASTVGHKNETLPKILVNVLIACRGGFRTEMTHLHISRSVLFQHSFDTVLLVADVSPHLLADW